MWRRVGLRRLLRTTGLRRWLWLACLAGLLLSPTARAGDSAVLLAATPLVLKDGRVARVTVHTIPFPIGKDLPDEAAQGR